MAETRSGSADAREATLIVPAGLSYNRVSMMRSCGAMSRQDQPLPFAEQVRAAVVRALALKPMEFSDLLGAMLNCDPVIVDAVLREEISGRNIMILDGAFAPRYYVANAARSEVDHRKLAPKRRAFNGTARSICAVESERFIPTWLASLPQAAPVFSQWWFAPAVYPRLLQLLTTRHPRPQRTAFLGSPTLGAFFSQVTSGHTTVLDVDAEVLWSLSSQFGPTADVITYDAAARLTSDLVGAFDLVFSDPPWSRSLLRLFVQRASELAREDATVIISFPQALTRPGLHEELVGLIDFASQAGLRLQGQMPAATEYVVPEFERRAYLNIGVQLTTPWRKGDLLFFRKSAPRQRCPIFCNSYAPSCWLQTRLGDERVFLRATDDCDDRAPAILAVSGNPGFVCSTTSSRSRAVQQASVVTTHNEIGIVHNWRAVRECLISTEARVKRALEQSSPRDGQASVISVVAKLIEGAFLKGPP